MNRIYRLIWNRNLRAVQVGSELARSPSAVGSTAGAATTVAARHRPLALALAVFLGGGLSSAAQGAITGANGAGGRNGTAVSGVPQGGSGGAGSLPGVNDGTAGWSVGGGAYAFGGEGGSLANQGVGGGGKGGAAGGGLGGGGGGGGGGLGLLVTASQTGAQTVTGGSGGAGGDGGAGGLGGNGGGGGGGAAVLITSGAVWTSTASSITGGWAGDGENTGNNNDGSGNGGTGGAAVLAADGSGFVNLIANAVRGGRGGNGRHAGNGGAGFEGGDGGSLVNGGTAQGTIIGGAGGVGVTVDGVQGRGGDGGIGALVGLHATLINNRNGTIVGGGGNYGQTTGNGGTGLQYGSGTVVTNYGDVRGGQAGLYCKSACTPGAGGTGVVSIGNGSVLNTGTPTGSTTVDAADITGGSGTLGWDLGGAGGDGVALLGNGATLVNSVQARISGGNGGGGSTAVGVGGAGGVGIDGRTGTGITNTQSAAIKGGNGGDAAKAGGAGGAAVVLSAGAKLDNSALVTGGMGGDGSSDVAPGGGTQGGTGGIGGAGVLFTKDSTLVNNGTDARISGGRGGAGGARGAGGDGGAGVDMGVGTTFENGASVVGGAGGQGNAHGVMAGGAGGVGVAVHAEGKLINAGAVTGGKGGADTTASAVSADGGIGGTGGVGVTLMAATATNAATGSVMGGAGGSSGVYVGVGGAGGAGFDLVDGSSLVNNGEIQGGAGNHGTKYGVTRTASGNGGAGVVLAGASRLTNAGSAANITGGTGGDNSNGGISGAAGAGVSLSGGGTIANIDGASITGGSGVTNRVQGLSGGAAGVGIVADGGVTILNAGLIAGGKPNTDKDAVQADAINLSGGANRLSLQHGYGFVGNVVSASGSTDNGDTLDLGGAVAADFDVSRVAAGPLATFDAGIGTRYYGFSHYEKSGASTWTLTGADAARINWKIRSGALQGDATSIQGTIDLVPDRGETASVIFNQGSGNANSPASGVYAGAISGNGSVSKIGDGTLVLTGDNTYSGVTTIRAGTLQLGNGGHAGSIVGDVIIDDGVLSFDRSGVVTYSGNISGGGSVQRIGSGTIVLTGINTYTGGTTISGGTLRVGNGSTGGTLMGDVTNNGVLDFNRSDTLIFDGEIAGGGTIRQNGKGMLVLNGTSSFTGDTTVNGGSLEIGDSAHATASLEGDVNVLAGATLRGHGRIGGNLVNDGTVRPGGSVGVLTLDGNYAQHAGGTLLIDVTPSQASQLQVGGTASLAGTLSLAYAPGTYAPTSYTLLQAQKIHGGFATTTSNGQVPTALDPEVTQTGAQLVLTLGGVGAPTPPTPPTPPTAPSAPLPPPPSVVAPLDGAIYANRMRLVNLTSQRDLRTVLDTGLKNRGCDGDQSSPAFICQSRTWVQTTGSSTSLAGPHDADASSFGLLGGFDRSVGETNMRLGAEAGASRINAHDASGGYGHTNDAHVGLYGMSAAGPLEISATVNYLRAKHYLTRPTGVGAAIADVDGRAGSAGLQFAWPLRVKQWHVAPRIGFLYQHQQLDGFSEAVMSARPLAAAYGVDGGRDTFNSLHAYGAVSITRVFQHRRVTYTPSFDLGYRYDARGSAPAVTASAQDGTAFVLSGAETGRGMASAGARITASGGDSWTIFLEYRGLFASRLHDNAASFGFTKHF